jgi:hypothetical protein
VTQDRPNPDRRPDAPFAATPEAVRATPAKVWGHLCTITRHKALVARYCFAVGLYRQGLAHDLSKYGPTEFLRGVRYYQGFRSPNAAERAHKGVSEAWLHHKGRNRHHSEYWVDVVGNGDARLEGKPMPTRYVVEMFCDRIAASRVYKGADYTDASPLEYYRLEHGSGPVAMHPAADGLLLRMLTMLAERGEGPTLRWVRDEVVRPRLVVGEHGRF